jgi:mono/diheme cytochrome c family protein
MSKELTGNPVADFREDMYGPSLTDSEFGVKLLAPDFLRADLRSVRPESRKEDLYRVIASGIGGTAMPTWKGSLPEEEIWAIVHFVDSLVAAKGSEDARRLRHANEAADETWKPPEPPP